MKTCFLQHTFLARVLVLGLLCASVLLLLFSFDGQSKKQLTFAVLNVGQGDALFIESPTGVQVLIDGGPGSVVLTELSKVMPMWDRSIDAVIETHPDADHISGLIDVVNRFNVGAFIEPGEEKGSGTAKALLAAVAEHHIPMYEARRGMVLDLGGGAYLNILFPDFDVSSLPESKSNNGSVVARLAYGSVSALLTGDTPQEIEQHLIQEESAELPSTILKVAHHGSHYSTGSAFLAAVRPSLAVISVGKNSYGHPSEEVLSRLEKAGVPTLRTDREGTLIFTSGGGNFVRVK